MSRPHWPCLRHATPDPSAASVLDISVSPNAPRTEIIGWHDGALRLRLAAPPVDGAANEALRKWLARELGVPQSQVTLLRGASGRRKQWRVDLAHEAVARWLAAQPALQKGLPHDTP